MLLIFFVVIILLNVLNFYLKYLNREKRPPIRTYGAVEVIGGNSPGGATASLPYTLDRAPAYGSRQKSFESRSGFRCS